MTTQHQIVDPFHAGSHTSQLFNPVANRYSGGAGQVHQFIRPAAGAQQHRDVKPQTLGRVKTAAKTATTGTLLSGQYNRTGGSTASSQFF